ncbi:uncharacterized protein LOC141600570 [Silene latifolia]|uniref:uncharacterized protein LOC141600570 n=1 Tax=Silene latifolia TaxID=37657 RepID=UPI003D787E59
MLVDKEGREHVGVEAITGVAKGYFEELFTSARREEAERVKAILGEYAYAPGQLVNYDTTTVSVSRGTRMSDRDVVVGCLGVRVVEEHEKYLGPPTIVGHSRKVVATVIRDKLLRSYKVGGKLFSKAGRELLIKAVAQSISTYAMSVFKLTTYFCDELRSIMSQLQRQGPALVLMLMTELAL